MSRKIFAVMLIALLSFGMVAHAAPATQNRVILGTEGGAVGITPPTETIQVRYGVADKGGIGWATLTSGTAVRWDPVSADAMTVSSCSVDTDYQMFVGILVDTLQTADSTAVRRNTRNWSQVCIRGYCLAKIDSGEVGYRLLVDEGGKLIGVPPGTTGSTSQDIGVLLEKPASDGDLCRVWIDHK